MPLPMILTLEFLGGGVQSKHKVSDMLLAAQHMCSSAVLQRPTKGTWEIVLGAQPHNRENERGHVCGEKVQSFREMEAGRRITLT